MLESRNIITIPTASGNRDNILEAAAIANELQQYGYVLDVTSVHNLKGLSLEEVNRVRDSIVKFVRKQTGTVKNHRSGFPNFPYDIANSSFAEEWLYTIFVLWFGHGRDLPDRTIDQGIETMFRKNIKLTLVPESQIQNEKKRVFGEMLTARSALSSTDVALLTKLSKEVDKSWFPETIPFKETLILATVKSGIVLPEHFKTATDVLRLAVGMSGGDITLTEPSRFVLKRKQRRQLLGLLEKLNQSQVETDMRSRREEWKRLCFELKVGDYKDRFPKTYRTHTAFMKKRFVSKLWMTTFKKCIDSNTITEYDLKTLCSQPGRFWRNMRRLVVIPMDSTCEKMFLSSLVESAKNCSTAVLTQAVCAVKNTTQYRVYKSTKPKFVNDAQSTVTKKWVDIVDAVVASEFDRRFMTETVMSIYVEPDARKVVVPFSLRTAEKALYTVDRGSRFPVDLSGTLRFFLHREGSYGWYDIAVAAYDSDMNMIWNVDWTCKNGGSSRTKVGFHSGDINSCGEPTTEFVDIPTKKLDPSVKYLVMNLVAWSGCKPSDMKECFTGYMTRSAPNSKELFDPRTVQHRVDLTNSYRQHFTYIVDVDKSEVVWLDMDAAGGPSLFGTTARMRASVYDRVMADLTMPKFTVADLMSHHGVLVDDPSVADVTITLADVCDAAQFISKWT